MSLIPQDLHIIHEHPKGSDFGAITVQDGRLSVRELIAVLQECPNLDAFVIVRNSAGVKLNCDVRLLDSVTPRRDCTVLLNFTEYEGWD